MRPRGSIARRCCTIPRSIRGTPIFCENSRLFPKSVAIELVPTIVELVDDLKNRISLLAGLPGMGVMIGPEAYMVDHMHEIAPLAAANRLPGISVYRQFAVEGGLMAYGPDIPTSSAAQRAMLIAFLKGRTRLRCRFRSRPNSSSS